MNCKFGATKQTVKHNNTLTISQVSKRDANGERLLNAVDRATASAQISSRQHNRTELLKSSIVCADDTQYNSLKTTLEATFVRHYHPALFGRSAFLFDFLVYF